MRSLSYREHKAIRHGLQVLSVTTAALTLMLSCGGGSEEQAGEPSPVNNSAVDMPPKWGPLAVIEAASGNGVDIGALRPAVLSITDECVTWDGFTLIWRNSQTSWDSEHQQITFVRDSEEGTLVLSDGDVVGLVSPGGGRSIQERDDWVSHPGASCPLDGRYVQDVQPHTIGGVACQEFPPEIQGTPPGTTPFPPLISDEEALRLQAEELAEDKGISVDEAIQVLKDQRTFDQLAPFKEKYADIFVGTWQRFQPQHTFFMRFDGPAPAEVRQKADELDLNVVFIEEAKYTNNELQALSRELHQALLDLGSEDLSTSFSAEEQTIEATAAPPPGLEDLSDAELIAMLPERFQIIDFQIRFEEGPLGGPETSAVEDDGDPCS